MPRILIVDDNADLRRVTARVLRHFSRYEVVTASGGSEALEILDRQPVDLILLDLSMPEMDGLTVLERLRGRDGRPRVPVLMLTAMAGDRERNRAMELGAGGFLVKSQVGVDELRSRVDACLAATP